MKFVVFLQASQSQNYNVSDISCSNEGRGGKQLIAAKLRWAKIREICSQGKDDIQNSLLYHFFYKHINYSCRKPEGFKGVPIFADARSINPLARN